MAQQSCPPGTTGLARWGCRSTSSGESTWSTFFPDLSECESFWTKKIISELRRSDSIVTISTDLVQYVSANHLYGGDIMSIISALTIITEKMEFQMNTIPTPEQREAMVVEVAQSLLKVGSVLLEVENLEAWQDLPDLLRSKFVSGFMNTLDRFTVLLHTALIKDQELSISSPNLLLVLKKMSFRNIRGSKFPSLAARGSRDWSRYMDHADIPALVLMENMDADGAHVAFLASNNLDVLLSPGRGPTRTEVINSQVMRVTMGEPHLTVREPVILVMRHLSVSNVTQPRCVHWSEDGWSDDKCLVSWSNVTHTACECSTMGTFAILETIEEEEKLDNVTFMLTLVVSVTVTIITAVSLALLVFYCKKVKVRDEWKYRLSVSGLPCFQQKRRELTGNLYSTSPTFINQNMFTSSDFMVLSQSSLDVQHLDASHLQGYIEHVHQHQLQQQQQQQCHVQPQLTHLQHYAQQSVHNAGVHNGVQADVQGGYHYTVGRSIPGPQVETKLRSGSKPQSFIQPGAQYGYEDAGHIYMEVDPFYSAHLAGPNPAYLSQTNLLPTQAHTLHLSHPLRPSNPSSNLPHSSTQEEFISSPDEEVCCSTPGLVSSNSSQSSSGYSTAPSEQYYTHGGHFRPGVLRADTLRCSEPSSSPYPNLQLTKDQVFAISQSFESQSQIPQENFCGLTRGPEGSSRRKTRERGTGSRAQERGSGPRAQELPLLSLQDTHLI